MPSSKIRAFVRARSNSGSCNRATSAARPAAVFTTMAKSSVIVVGEGRLAEELIGLARAANYDAKLYPDADAAAISSSLIVETLSDGEARKREILKKLDSGSPSAVILTSCLRRSPPRHP